MVDGNRATAVYRILQEALTNVARHAQAGRVDIVLRIASDELELIVRDNGRGVSQEELTGPRSLGILGMWERANSWGGELSVAGAPGAGTIVRLTMPLVARRQPQSTP
jgi:signal transduction histidine kinase